MHGFVPENPEQVRAALSPYFLVAEINQQVVGFISGSFHTSEGTAVMPEGESYFEIDNLYVLPEHRRLGVGGSLIKQSLARAKERGAVYALLHSASKDIHSILRFYEQHKFQSWYVQMFRKL